jgi:MFS family permease
MSRTLTPSAALAVICLGALIGPLDSAVNVVFPLITRAFELPLRDIQWVVIGYVFAQAWMSLVTGHLGDLYGHRRIFACAMAGCAVAHAAVGLAPSYGWLIALRIVQGLAVGAAVACGPALASLLFDPGAKRRVLGVYVTVMSLGGALGPLVGGVAAGWVDWPGAFWSRVPLALVVLLLLPLVPDARAATPTAHAGARQRSFDWRGALYVTAAFGALMLAAGEMSRPSFGAAAFVLLIGAAATGLALFVRHERRTPHPLLNMRYFRDPGFTRLQLASIAVNLAAFSIMLLVPYALADRLESSIATGGVVLAMFPAGALLGALGAARATRAVTSAMLVRAGVVTAALGLLATAALVTHETPAMLAPALVLTGSGLGIFQVGYFDMTTSLLPPEERGVAGSLVSLTRLAGVMLGAALGSWAYELLRDFRLTIAAFGGGLLLLGILAMAARAPGAGLR